MRDDEPISREGRVLRDAVTCLVEREHQLRAALHDRAVFKELAVALMGALHDATKANRRLRETVTRQSAIIREHVTPMARRERRAA